MGDLELLVSTMHQKNCDVLRGMRIQTDTLLINQTKEPMDCSDCINGHVVRMKSFHEWGVSRSRNRALDLADAEICHIADDDFRCDEGYAAIIKEAYERNPDADIIVFKVPHLEPAMNKVFSERQRKVGFLLAMKVVSSEITFRLPSIRRAGVRFREEFGVGSNVYTLGEENIFLFDCLRKGLKIRYIPAEIGVVGTRASTWFRGYDETYMFARGASFAAMSPVWAWLLILQYALRKYKKYGQHMNPWTAWKIMRKGCSDYRRKYGQDE